MKFSVFSCIFNEAEYIKYWLDQAYPHVDEIVLVDGTFAPHTKHYDEPHSKGMSKDNIRSNDGTYEKIRTYPDPDKKIKILPSDGDQIDCMNLGISKCTSDYLLVIDIDEFYLDIPKLKQTVSNNRQYDAFTADFMEFYFSKNLYMMNPNKVLMCVKNFMGVRFTKSRTVNAKTYKHIDQKCFHYSYLRSPERIRQKIVPYGEKGIKWYQNVYQNYSGKESLEKIYKLNNNSVHLLFPNKHLIEYNEKHPEALKDHPLFIDNIEVVDKPTLSILIPSYNRVQYLRETLNHIKRNTQVSYEVIIVDDNSPDKSLKNFLRSIRDKRIRIYYNEEGLGFVKTIDKAIRLSKADHFAILNNDTYVQSGWDINALNMMHIDDKIGMVGFKLYFMNDTIQTCGWKRNNDKIGGFLHEGKHKDDPSTMQEENVLYAPLGIVKKSAYYDVGGVDCRFHMGWSDVSFGIMLNACNYKIKYCPTSKVLHRYPEESRAHSYNEDMWLFRAKHPNWRQLMGSLSGIVGGQDYDNAPKDMGSVDILIITNNRLKYSRQCFEYLRKNTDYKNVHFYVVDNASTDGTVEYLKNQTWIDELILNSKNIPISQVTNMFWHESKANYLIKLDNDTLVSRRWITRLLEAHRQISNPGIIGGFHFDPKLFDYTRSQHLIETYGSSAILRQKFIGGCCFITSKELINKVGLQENKKMLYGLTEFQIKLHNLGYKNGYVYPFIIAQHIDCPDHPLFDDSEENLQRLKRTFALRGMKGDLQEIIGWYTKDAMELLCQKI